MDTSDQEKFCTGCNATKPVSQFHRDKTHKDGYKSHCKECRSGRPPGLNEEPSRIKAEMEGKTRHELELLARSKAIRRLIEDHEREFYRNLGKFRQEFGIGSEWRQLG